MKEQIKVAAVVSTDWHLKRENVEEIIDLVNQQCELAVKLGVETLFCLGDIFDSRKSQELVVLTAFKDFLLSKISPKQNSVLAPSLTASSHC